MDRLTIFFDLDDTLYDRSIPYERAFSQFFGGRYAEKLPQAFDAVIHRGYEVFTDAHTGKISMEAMHIYRHQTGLADAGISITPDEALRGVFMGMLDNNEKLLAGVENASVEIGYGFTGWIEHRRVLLGSREMMKRHDIEVPSLDYEKKYTKNGQRSPIYLAVAGKLFGMFLVSYRPDRRAAERDHHHPVSGQLRQPGGECAVDDARARHIHPAPDADEFAGWL